jgi:hypothetical protein
MPRAAGCSLWLPSASLLCTWWCVDTEQIALSARRACMGSASWFGSLDQPNGQEAFLLSGSDPKLDWLKLNLAHLRLVLSALSKETRRIKGTSSVGLAGWIATDIVTPKPTEDVLGWSKQIKNDIHNGRQPRVIVLYLIMNVTRNYLASGKFASIRNANHTMRTLGQHGGRIVALATSKRLAPSFDRKR